MTGTDQDRAHAEVTRRQRVVGPSMGVLATRRLPAV